MYLVHPKILILFFLKALLLKCNSTLRSWLFENKRGPLANSISIGHFSNFNAFGFCIWRGSCVFLICASFFCFQISFLPSYMFFMSPFFLFPTFSFSLSFLCSPFVFFTQSHILSRCQSISFKNHYFSFVNQCRAFSLVANSHPLSQSYIDVPQACFKPLTLPFSSLHFATYRVSLTIFFSLLNVCFLLSTARVHSPPMCASHNNFSTSCYIWLGFLISFTHHS